MDGEQHGRQDGGMTSQRSPITSRRSPARLRRAKTVAAKQVETATIVTSPMGVADMVSAPHPAIVSSGVAIPGEEEFNRVLNQVTHQYSSLVEAFCLPVTTADVATWTSDVTHVEGHAMRALPLNASTATTHVVTTTPCEKTKGKPPLSSRNQQRANVHPARIFPDYVAPFAASGGGKTTPPSGVGRGELRRRRALNRSRRGAGNGGGEYPLTPAYVPAYQQQVNGVSPRTKRRDNHPIEREVFGGTPTAEHQHRGFVQRHVARRGENRMSSSTSDDDSDVAATSQVFVAKQTPDSSDNERGGGRGNRDGRRARRLRTRKYHAHQQQQMATTRHDPVTSQQHDASRLDGQSPARETKRRYRDAAVAAARDDDKYSTLPADFSPVAVAPGKSSGGELMISDVATTQERGRGRGEGGRKASFDRVLATTPAGSHHRQQNINDLRNIFNKPQEKLSEVGISYAGKKEELTARRTAANNSLSPPSAINSSARVADACSDLAAEVHSVGAVSSRPLVVARKISEDYWPRDEITERLLGKKGEVSYQHNTAGVAAAKETNLNDDPSYEFNAVAPHKQLTSVLDHSNQSAGCSAETTHGSSTETLISAGEMRGGKLSRSQSIDSGLYQPRAVVNKQDSLPPGLDKSPAPDDAAADVTSCRNDAILEESDDTSCHEKSAGVSDNTVSLARKSSVVSLSTALPTRKTSSAQQPTADNINEYDEGVYTDFGIQIANDGGLFTGGQTSSTARTASFRRQKKTEDVDAVVFDKHLDQHYASSDRSIYSDNNSLPDDKTESTSSQIDIDLEEMELKTTGKAFKKKSYSDPNATAVRTGLMEAAESVLLLHDPSDSGGVLHASCSEPALKEQSDELSTLDHFQMYQKRVHSAPRRNATVGIEGMTTSLQEMTRRLSPLHSPSTLQSPLTPDDLEDNDLDPDPGEEILQEVEQFQTLYDIMTSKTEVENVVPVAHIRSVSEPVAVEKNKFNRGAHPQADHKGRRFGIIQAPSLCDVTQTLKQSDIATSKQLSSSVDHIPGNRLDYREDFHFPTREKLDMRKYVVKNLLETEDSYVNSLRILYENYLKPLKRPENHSICEPRLVDEIFFQIPEILQHHERFFVNVRDRFENWDPDSVKMGELFMQSFNKDMLLETYTSYINNYLNAREAVTVAVQAKSAFKMFLEHCQRENKEKQGLSDLMIKPVQRIPRYELIIKDLLKHTPESHLDRSGLLIAQQEIHALSVQMNKGEKEAAAAERQARQLQDIEQLIEGCIDIGGVAKRRFIRQDICMEMTTNKKDRSLWLFNDLLMCTTSKKGRAGSMRRSSLNLWPSTSVEALNFDYTGKYKFLWKFPLEDVELLKGSSLPNRQSVEKQIQQIRQDHDVLVEMEKMATDLFITHHGLDDAIRDLMNVCNQRMAEKQQITSHGVAVPGRLEIGISTQEGMKSFQFEFATDESKSNFENMFRNSKESITQHRSRWDPAFMKAIPISKTRNGMQFSCAAPNTDTSPTIHEVWVCNTDGYVGQICFLALEPEPSQTQCITVCNTKICCIAQVPTATWDRKLVPTQALLNEISKVPLGGRGESDRRPSVNSNPAHRIIAWDDTDETDEDNTSPLSTISSRSPYSTNNSLSNFGTDMARSMVDIQFSDEEYPSLMSPLITSPSLLRKFGFLNKRAHVPTKLQHSYTYSSFASIPDVNSAQAAGGDGMMIENMLPALLGGGAFKKGNNGSTLHGSLEDLLDDSQHQSSLIDGSRALANQGSMWLGTEDGKIKVYSTVESVRHNKHCVELPHNASVQCILYHAGQVFVALSNGDLSIYFRDVSTGQWDFDNKKILSLGTSPYPITKMLVVGEKELWCGCQNQIRVLDIRSHNIKSFFSVSQDFKRSIYCMATYGFGVWVALDRRPTIKLYHTITHNLLADFDVSSAVSKMLAGSDAIIRQHKAACLRITALLVCKDLLWVGTSAGVVLTLALPSLNPATSSLPLPIIPQGLAYGHTGHVRFLTAVETLGDKEISQSLQTGQQRRTSSTSSSTTTSNKRRMSSSSATASSQPRCNTLVISGGDGYEDFGMNSAAEAAGREDSTNHLLVWRV